MAGEITILHMPELLADGHECRAELSDDGRWRVFAGKTFIGGIERRGEIDWRLLVAFAPDEQLGSRLVAVPEDINGPFELASDAAAKLAETFGLSTELRQITFRQAVEKDIDMTEEQKAYWLGTCDKEGV